MKKIIISNEKDYKKFINKIIIYKSIIYKNTKFEVDNKIKNEEIDIIIKALNIKNRYQRIIYIYDQICKKLNQEIDFSICKFINNKCIVQRNNNSINCNGCCLTCKYLKNNHCTTQNISCKLLYCPTMKKQNRVIKMKDISLFKFFSFRQRLILKFDFFESREEVLKDLKYHSFLISCHKIFKRKRKEI